LLLVAVLDRRPRAALAYLLGVGVTTGLGALLLVVHDGSWVDFYLVQLPRRHSLALADLGLFWTRKILPGATLPLLLAPVFFIGRALRGERQLVRFWALAGAGLVGLSWAAMLNRWSDDNVLLPAFAVFAILAALGVDEVLRGLGQATRQARAWRMYAFVLLAVEFAVIGYNPRQTSPLRSDVWAADRLVSTVASLPGAVYGPDFAEYLYQAGKGDVALGLGILELEGGFGGAPLPQGSAWIAAYRAALDERRFDELLLDPESVEPFLADEAASSGYIDTGPLFPPNDVYWSWGGHLAPRPHVWLPRERAQ
jgi:hypothetical protein